MGMAHQLSDFIGKIVEYVATSITRGIKKYMRVRVRVNFDVREPLKRKKRTTIGQNNSTCALFQYKKKTLFCFIGGKLGHGERFCLIRLTLEPQEVAFRWDLSLRASPRKAQMEDCKWLREDNSRTKSMTLGLEGDIGERRVGVTQNFSMYRGWKGKEVARQEGMYHEGEDVGHIEL